MALKLTITDARRISPGIWWFEMPPHQLRHFGTTPHAAGQNSIVLLKQPTFDPSTQQLQVNVDHVTPVNVGTTNRVIGVSTDDEGSGVEPSGALPAPTTSFGPGDREFLRLAKHELSDRMAAVAKSLLEEVRKRSPGDLKRGQSKNFSETPDNFWYVIVQPRIDELSITVRGSVQHFSRIAKLEIKDDRGNTRFKVGREQDLPAALDLIFHAHRKR